MVTNIAGLQMKNNVDVIYQFSYALSLSILGIGGCSCPSKMNRIVLSILRLFLNVMNCRTEYAHVIKSNAQRNSQSLFTLSLRLILKSSLLKSILVWILVKG